MSIVVGALVTCERCWTQQFIPEQTDTKIPEKWQKIDTTFICPSCVEEYLRMKKSFMQACFNCMNLNTENNTDLCKNCCHWDSTSTKNHWTPAGADGKLNHPRPST